MQFVAKAAKSLWRDLHAGGFGRSLHPFRCTPLEAVSKESKILGFFYSKELYK